MENTSYSNPPVPQKNRTVAGWVFGGLSFLPLFGVVFGIVAIVIGAVKKVKGPIFLGIGGILFTILIYGGLFYFGFVANKGIFAELKVKLVSQELNSLAGQIALYKNKNGKLPEKLGDLGNPTEENPIIIFDPWMNNIKYTPSPDGKFRLESAGPDKEFGTSDDIGQSF